MTHHFRFDSASLFQFDLISTIQFNASFLVQFDSVIWFDSAHTAHIWLIFYGSNKMFQLNLTHNFWFNLVQNLLFNLTHFPNLIQIQLQPFESPFTIWLIVSDSIWLILYDPIWINFLNFIWLNYLIQFDTKFTHLTCRFQLDSAIPFHFGSASTI